MLLNFAFQDFMQDRKFKNTISSSIQNYKLQLGGFADFCPTNNVLNVESITAGHIKDFMMEYQE